MAKIVAVFSAGLKDGDEPQRRDLAWGALSVLVGGLNLSRALRSTTASAAAAATAKSAAIAIAGATKASV
ncbi:hypothetical protein [Pelagicoccus sp. SDUM812002]|uniref:hypothetical protein n=1 Tax=Pelagicoccus sp. SDUM812002 TaxID=3041266 RepID=UPI00280EA87E|nr:hypothetical protein [Pelagicoccus sp. SDUM812002]MDQ8186315.1 hypothetical protein [Pelagicoccus sp. SDUM812002]